MAQSDSAERSHKATPRRLRDARRQGNVANSRDVSRTATSLVWVVLLVTLPALFAETLAEFVHACLAALPGAATADVKALGREALTVLAKLTLLPIGIVALVGVVATRLQTGPVLSLDPIKPKLERLDPVAGIKRIFSLANLFETFKGIVKITVIATLVLAILLRYANDIALLLNRAPLVTGQLDHWLHTLLLGLSAGALLVVAIVDALFQRYNYQKQLKMSTDDVRRERKEQDGDPTLRSQRRKLQRQWASGNAQHAARSATALVVNPTHLAVAVEFDEDSAGLPLISGCGEGNLAALMRREAELAGVPILRSVPLARALYWHADEDDVIPERLFDAVAEVLAWALAVRAAADRGDGPIYREADARFDQAVLASAP